MFLDVYKRQEQNALILTHKSLMKTEVIPAYQELMTGLEALRGTGKNNRGLTYFKGGKEMCIRDSPSW